VKGGRPPYDAVLMFRVLVLQTLYTLSDDQTEYQLRDRLSFMRFVGLELHDAVPDAKTIWLYREQLKRAGAIDTLFRRFDAVLIHKGYLAMGGQIIDATIVAAPKQKLSEDEKAVIKAGGSPAGWSRAKRRQKDRDARWTLKRGRSKPQPEDGTTRTGIEIAVPMFGYKSHLNIDRRHGLIRTWSVTDAAAHDSRSVPCWMRRTRPVTSGPIRPTGPSTISRHCSGAGCGSSSRFAARHDVGSPRHTLRRTPPGRGCAPPSSMCSPGRSTAWHCSSAPSGWRAPE